MKKLIFSVLCAALCLAGCEKEAADIPDETVGETEALEELDETIESETVEDIADAQEEIVLPDVFYAMDVMDPDGTPEGFVIDEAFTEAAVLAIYEQTGGLDITARVMRVYGWIEDGVQRFVVDYAAFPRGAEIRWQNCLYSPIEIGLAYLPDEGYVTAEPGMIDEEGPKIMAENLELYKSDPTMGIEQTAEEYLYIDREDRLMIHRPEGDVMTELYYKGDLYFLDAYNLLYADGDIILVCGREDSIYDTSIKISISRDGGNTWYTQTPVLEPLGENGQHIELGFTAGKIQMMDDGQFYIFLNTNLSSMTVLTIPAGSDEVEVLFREQIGGYETTSLVDAAMVNEERGFYTLTYPKYRESNAIYRTTDGGESWVRCDVPMPDEVKDHHSMRLHLPYQIEGEGTSVWHMKGDWDSGECIFVSYDGGWTWEIGE